MKELEFENEINKIGLGKGILQEIHYTLDDDYNVLLDEDCIREGFENKLNEVKEFLK